MLNMLKDEKLKNGGNCKPKNQGNRNYLNFLYDKFPLNIIKNVGLPYVELPKGYQSQKLLQSSAGSAKTLGTHFWDGNQLPKIRKMRSEFQGP